MAGPTALISKLISTVTSPSRCTVGVSVILRPRSRYSTLVCVVVTAPVVVGVVEPTVPPLTDGTLLIEEIRNGRR